MFFAAGLISGGIEGAGASYIFLLYWTRFRRCGGRRVQFSYFVLSDSFFAVSRVRGPVFIFDGTEGPHILFSCFAISNHFWWYQGMSGPVLMFCGPRLILGSTEGVRSSFNGLRFMTHFRQHQGHGV
jgi:hypothetical protein